MKLNKFNLSDIQKFILVKIFNVGDPKMSWSALTDKISDKYSDNILSDIDELYDDGAVNKGVDWISISDEGMELMTDAGLIDDSGQLTDNANNIKDIYSKEPTTSKVSESRNFKFLNSLINLNNK